MNARWILVAGWLVAATAGSGQEAVLVDDPFAAAEADVEEVDPFAEAEGVIEEVDPFAEADGEGCGDCGDCGEDDPFAAEDTDREDGAEDDPFAAGWEVSGGAGKIPARRATEVRQTVRVRAETWEVDAGALLVLLDRTNEAGGMRGEFQRSGQLVFSPVLALDARSRAEVESITEQIYPTEYEGCGGLPTPPEGPPEPEEMTPIERVIDAVGSQALPTAFETRNTGLAFEAAVQPVEADPGTWDVSVSLEEVRQMGMANYGAEELVLKMPIFTTFRTVGLLRVNDGEWQLLSVLEPPRGVDGEPAGRSWVTIVRVDRVR